MNIALLLLDNFEVPEKLGFSKVFRSARSDPEKKFADLTLQLDEYIYIDGNTVDLVFVAATPNIDFNIPTTISHDSIYFVDKIHTGSFICAPHVFSMLGNLYKVNYTDHNPDLGFNEPLHIKKMFYLIDRLGLGLHVI